jgi:hypothetical protein
MAGCLQGVPAYVLVYCSEDALSVCYYVHIKTEHNYMKKKGRKKYKQKTESKFLHM